MKNIVIAVLVAGLVHAIGWNLTREAIAPPNVVGTLNHVSYAPYRANQNPEKGDRPVPEQVERDLRQLSQMATGIRLYSSTGGQEIIPAMARRHGLNVSVGAWIDKDEARNRREIESAVQLARANRNVRSIIVGNETVLRKEKTQDELAQLIRQVKKRAKVPVSTGETWHVWLANPRLVNAVDFIAVHLLPYWEGVPADRTVEYAFSRYDQLREAYPGKRIVIAEFGWPSRGYNFLGAVPDPLVQAQTLRAFIAEANRRGVDYNIVEAIDQPWKSNEGSVGQYWGLLDAERNAKFSFTGALANHDQVTAKAAVALLLGLAIAAFGLRRRNVTLGHALTYAASANVMAAGLVAAATYPFEHYLNFGGTMMWVIGFGLMIPLTVITVAKIHEVASVLFGERPRRLIEAQAPRIGAGPAPKVSIHIPAYREPADMVIETLNSVAALDYADFECVIVINNTPERDYWKPVEAHCRALGERFKFVNVEKLAGFKAGALNEALRHTDPAAEVIAILDADYAVTKDWLKDLVPWFADPKVALVQAPQDHRDGARSVLNTAMNSEYAGFFDVGMVERNEHNAIIIHGTMLLVRRRALDEAGGWTSDTIVEDAELGLRLFRAGYQAHYTARRYGFGLLPTTYRAFKTQRERWAYGAIQIIKKHWRAMLPAGRQLTARQKSQYVTGWAFWLSDAFGALAAILNLLWVPVIILIEVLVPTVALTLPVLLAFVVNLLHCILLYRARVRISERTILGAAVAVMSLQYTVAKAVLDGLVKDNLPFKRTDKGKTGAKKRTDVVLWETVIGLGLVAAATWLYTFNFSRQQITEMNVFALALAVQSIPFLSAMVMRGLERAEEHAQARGVTLRELVGLYPRWVLGAVARLRPRPALKAIPRLRLPFAFRAGAAKLRQEA
ncbi:MAG: glycosyltransferase [Alphaproteobacteria bacterium]|nr:glycosyltransferase [Alphaproteobacteria bacterium]